MKVLLDHNVPVQLARLLQSHLVTSARSLGWNDLENGDLLKAAEQAGFDVMVTGDKGIHHQQDHRRRKIALVFIGTTYRPSVVENAQAIDEAISRCTRGSIEKVDVGPSRATRTRAIE